MINLQKVHLDQNNKLSITYTETEDGQQGAVPTSKGPYPYPVHPDLLKSVEKLDIHLAMMSGQVAFESVGNEGAPGKHAQGFNARGYSRGGTKKPNLTLFGNRVLENKKVFNFPTPFYAIDDQNEQTKYPFMAQLVKRVERIETEVLAFLDGSKRGEDPQGKLFPDDNVTTAQIAEPMTAGKEVDVTELYVPGKNGTDLEKKFVKGTADPEAMKRVKEWDEAENQNRAKNKAVRNQSSKVGKKRVAQSASNPDGLIDDNPDETTEVD